MSVEAIPSPLKTLRLALATLAVLLLAFGLVACGGGGDDAGEPADTAGGEAAPPATETAPAGGDAAALGTAQVTGTVVYSGDVPSLQPIDLSADPDCASKHEGGTAPAQVLMLGPDQKTLGNVLVYVKSGLPDADWPVPSEPTVMDQEGCIYHPHVMGTMANQQFLIKNSDGLLHNVHALPKENREFNLGMPAGVTESTQTFARPEDVFQIKCDVHPWMNAWVRVFEHPFFDTTVEDGRFTIGQLPAGTYEIEAWHERLGTQTGSVTVDEGGTATVDFTFSR